MCHQDRHVAVDRVGLGGEGVAEREIGREREDAGQPRRIAQAGVQRDGPALREAREDDPMRRDAPFLLALDEGLDSLLGGADAGGILPAVVCRCRTRPASGSRR